MSNFYNSSGNQPDFKIRISGKNSVFRTLTSTHNIDNNHAKKSFLLCWWKAISKRGIKTINKVPQRKNWTDPRQVEISVEELLRKFGEYGVRTGSRLGNKYFEGVDIDIEQKNVAFSLRKRFETNFELLAKKYRISYIKTKRGYHIYCLFDELTPNETIYHVDKYGKKRNLGSVLSSKKQLQGVGSKDKKWVNNGRWFWHLKNRAELKEKLARFFFLLSDDEKVCKNPLQNQKSNQNYSKNPYQIIRLEKIWIISKQITKKTDCYRVNYCDKQKRRGFFFLDSYFRDKKELIQPNLMFNLIIARGEKYQFFLGIP